MLEQSEREQPQFEVVMNLEEQYSIWAVGKAIPAGWHAVGYTGAEQECLEHIKQVWTDMRPLSLRQQMQERS